MLKISGLSRYLRTKEARDAEWIDGVISADPAMGCTGYSLILIANNSTTVNVVDACYTEPAGVTYVEKMKHLNVTTMSKCCDYKALLEVQYEKTRLLGGGIEVPAILTGGFEQSNRDRVQLDAVAMVRLGFANSGIRVIGDDDDKPVRPNQVHALCGAGGRGLTSEQRKEIVFDWVKQNCIFWTENEVKRYDQTDAIAIAIVAYKMFKGLW